MAECIFCRIVSGEIPSTKVFENKKFLAFLDINPASKGHTLAIPKKHFETLLEIPQEELKELVAVIQKISKAIDAALSPDGFNIHQSNKPVAGQVVSHLHFHIIPRAKNDSVGLHWSHEKYAENELQEMQKKIKEKMQ